MPRPIIRTIPYSVDVATNAGILVNNAASLSPTNVVALEIWFKLTPYQPIILFDNSQAGVTNSYFLSAGNGKMSWFSTIGGVAKNISNVGSVRFYDWNFASGFYDGLNVVLCLNGSQISTLAATGAMGTNSGQLRIGQYYSAGVPVIGKVARPRIYNRIYTLRDHRERYYNNLDDAAMRSGLVLDMPMTEGSGSSVADVSGLANNGTFSRAIWSTDTPIKSRVLNSAERGFSLVRSGSSVRSLAI